MCSIIVLFLFVSFIVTAVYAWLHPAIGAVCVSSAFACVFHLLSASNNSHVPQIRFGSVINQTKVDQRAGQLSLPHVCTTNYITARESDMQT